MNVTSPSDSISSRTVDIKLVSVGISKLSNCFSSSSSSSSSAILLFSDVISPLYQFSPNVVYYTFLFSIEVFLLGIVLRSVEGDLP